MILKVIKIEEHSKEQVLIGLRSERSEQSENEDIYVQWYVPLETIKSYWLGQKFGLILASESVEEVGMQLQKRCYDFPKREMPE